MKIGIIGAMDEELIPIRAILNNLEKLEKGKRTFWHGEDYGNQIFLTRCDPGKVNAVIATQQMIDLFEVDAIFNMGSSGALAPELEVGDLVVASEFIQHDYDVTDWGLKPGELLFDILMSNETGQMQFRSQQIFKSHPGLTQLAVEIAKTTELTSLGGHSPKIFSGRILSGDQFIGKPEKARELWNTHHGLCTDMKPPPSPILAKSIRCRSCASAPFLIKLTTLPSFPSPTFWWEQLPITARSSSAFSKHFQAACKLNFQYSSGV